MKRFINVLLIACLLYFAYQGWQKFINKDQLISDTESVVEESKSTLLTNINEAVGAIQSSIADIIAEKSNQDVPTTVTTVNQTNEDIVGEISSYLDTRTTSFVVDVYGERKHISDSMEAWIEEALLGSDYTRYALQGYSYSIIGYSQYSEVSFEFQYRETEEQTDYVRKFVKDLLLEHQVANMNDHEKIKWIHDWIVTHVQYDQSLTRYTAYEALTEKLAVCQGYALLGQMMLQEAGFESRIAEGEVNTGNHAWNMVKLSGKWYHIDFTWDDPIGQEEHEISYQYYLVSDHTLRNDHSWTRTYPTASTNYRDDLNQAITTTTGEQQQALKLFRESLQFHWFEDEYTIKNSEQLKDVMLTITSQKQINHRFRYMQTDTLIKDLKKAFEIANVGLSYQVQYKPLSDEGDSLVTVTISYH